MSDVASGAEYRRFRSTTHVQLQSHVADLERQATTTRAFVCGLIPGLLQTPAYAEGVFARMAALMHYGPEGTGPAAVHARIRRQSVLDDPGKQFHFVIPESALLVPLCAPEEMRAQVDHLIAALKRQNVRFGVIPLEASAELAALHGFVIADDAYVSIEMFTAELILTDADDVRLHRDAFEKLAASALYDDDLRTLLETVRARAV